MSETTEIVTNYGPLLAVTGAALSAILGGLGSSIGIGIAGNASAGVAAERPEAAGKLIVLTALPGSQAIYGLVGAFLVINFFGQNGGFAKLDFVTGFEILFACLPVAFGSLISAIYQGKIAAAATNIAAKDPSKAGTGIVLAAIVETVAILGLLVTVLLLITIKG